MNAVLLRALAYILMIFMGYALKRVGFFAPTDYRIFSNIVMNITLPAAVITSFASQKIDPAMILIVLLGLSGNLILILVGYLISLRRSSPTRLLYMLNIPGYNIGAFTMPFAQSFLGPLGGATTSLFDTGNALMVTGGTFALASRMLKSGQTVRLRDMFRILRSSMPFLTYFTMLVLIVLRIRIPDIVVSLVSPIGAANAFVAMLMIGLMFEIRPDRKSVKKAAVILLVRYLGSAALALIFYNLLPFSRQALVIVVFSPISVLAPTFTERGQGDGALASLINSLSIVISLVLITGLILVLGIGA